VTTSRFLLASAVLAALSAPGSASAQGDDESAAEGRVKVAVFVLADDPLTNALHARLSRGLERALRRNGKIDVRDRDLLYAEFAGEIPNDAVAEARAFLKTGRELLGQDRPRDALLKLAAADSALENVLAFVKKSELADAQFLRGVAQVKTGDKKAARATFARLIAWRTDYVVDVGRFPGALPVWEEARRQVKRSGLGALQITSEPEGAMAFVDGRYAGATPVTASNLAAGEHYVTLKAEGYKRKLIKANVDPKYDELVSESLPKSEKYHLIAELLAKVRGEVGREEAGQALGDLKGFLGLEQVVLLKVTRHGGLKADGYLYDLRSKTRLAQVTGVKLPADDEAADLKLEEMASTLYLNVRYDGRSGDEPPVAGVGQKQPSGPRKKSGPAFYTKWWFWAIVGGVVVAGTTPFVVGAIADSGGPSCPGGHACTELVWDF
jgi:hypothetical protein